MKWIPSEGKRGVQSISREIISKGAIVMGKVSYINYKEMKPFYTVDEVAELLKIWKLRSWNGNRSAGNILFPNV